MRKFVLILLIAVRRRASIICRRRVGGEADWSAARRSSTSAAPIARVSLDRAPTSPTPWSRRPSQLLVNGKTPGTISMYRLGAQRRRCTATRSWCSATWRVPQRPDEAPVPGRVDRRRRAAARASCSPGIVSNKGDRSTEAINVAGGYVEKADEVVNMLLQSRRAPPATRCCCASASPKSAAARSPSWARRCFTGASGYKDDPRADRRRTTPCAGDSTARIPATLKLGRSATSSTCSSSTRSIRPRRRDQGAADARAVPEPGRAEPRGRERQGSRASSPAASSRCRSRRAPARNLAISVSSRSSACG